MEKKITIIEDDADLRNLLQLGLTSAGFIVDSYPDGNVFLTKVEMYSDMFIIDMNLGLMSGLDLCKYLKSEDQTLGIPIIIIISANPDFRALALEACADDTLSKPFTLVELLKLIRTLFKVDNKESKFQYKSIVHT